MIGLTGSLENRPLSREIRAELSSLSSEYHHLDLELERADHVGEILRESGQVDIVVHTMALESSPTAVLEPLRAYHATTTTTLQLVEGLRRYAPDALLVSLSSLDVHAGLAAELPLLDETKRLDLPVNHRLFEGFRASSPTGPCAGGPAIAFRQAAESIVAESALRGELRAVVLRTGSIAGSCRETESFLRDITRAAFLGESVLVDLEQDLRAVTDTLHVDDLTEAVRQVAESPACGRTFSIGGGRAGSWSGIELLHRLEELSGRSLETEFVDTLREPGLPWAIADTRAFRDRYPDWSIRVDLEGILEGLIAGIASAS